MDSTTMTKNAARCVASARLRVDGRLLRAAVRVPAQGTAVSFAGPITGSTTDTGLGLGSVLGAVARDAAGVRVDATVPFTGDATVPFTGEVSALAYSAFMATDVVRSPSGRPPV
ncbi:hypothetical protein DFJ68_2037 [Terracoccus luteus]|uniref:Uncharacterized protein n=1 Tax=Terracoccus luteus TaxID=53356 RepID=A0A495XZ48_9MICO|nr:hypothetical protein [Terracoccus luteus]RKT78589.1 hypothetical protein DFJ68_2037 [Terracoccus luteus]